MDIAAEAPPVDFGFLAAPGPAPFIGFGGGASPVAFAALAAAYYCFLASLLASFLERPSFGASSPPPCFFLSFAASTALSVLPPAICF